MKPIKLLISAFGPYADTMPEINFEQFEDQIGRASCRERV